MTQAGAYYDERETRDPEARERAQFEALRALVAEAKAKAPGWAWILAAIEPHAITDRRALAALPVTRKSDLLELQRGAMPFAGLTTRPPGALRRLYASPGPIYDPESERPDFWRMGRALHAAGFRQGDIVHNSFSYHLTPAGARLVVGARALGCAVIPAGVGNSELQARSAADLGATAYTGTPSFLKILLDKAGELGLALALKRALVSGEALPPSLRGELESRGLSVLQAYGTADCGLIAYESEAKEGLILDEDVILELLRPGTGDPVGAGEVGEVTVSVLNPDYPLIRFATGDLSALLPGRSPCGRTGLRIKGWMGRADQTAKLRGMFVRPGQVAEVLRRHPAIRKARLVIESRAHQDHATLACELSGPRDERLAAAIAESFHAVCKLRAEIAFAAPGALPNDGKVIDDRRKYD
jgi:phenylacetate-CoA ligase